MYAHTGRPASARKSRRKNHTEQQQRSSNNSTTKKFQQVFQVFAILFFPLKTSTTFFFPFSSHVFPIFRSHINISFWSFFYLASCVYIVLRCLGYSYLSYCPCQPVCDWTKTKLCVYMESRCIHRRDGYMCAGTSIAKLLFQSKYKNDAIYVCVCACVWISKELSNTKSPSGQIQLIGWKIFQPHYFWR